MKDEELVEKVTSLEGRLASLEAENSRLSRAKDVHEIQNVMSLHAHYHAACQHAEELGAIWAQDQDDVSFEEALFEARFVGLKSIERYYVDFMVDNILKSANAITRALFPQVRDDPEDTLAFGIAYFHTLTTPLIEVAEDGQTAKGVWVSPGFMTLPSLEKLKAYWHWDRYGVDFIKEGGKWKIWHLFVGREFCSPYEKSWVDATLDGEEPYEFALQIFKEWPGYAEARSEPINPFATYSPYKVARLQPRLPVPYGTFSETFSY